MSLVRCVVGCALGTLVLMVPAFGQSPADDGIIPLPSVAASAMEFAPPPIEGRSPAAGRPATFDPNDPLSAYDMLPLEVFVDLVTQRHPNTAAAVAAWQSAAARYPQVVALDDPMLDYITAPGSIGSNQVDYAFAVQGRQKVPWFGKRNMRGQQANHATQAAFQDSLDVRLQLVEAATAAYFEYYTAMRRRDLNDANRAAVDQFRRNALDRYQTGLVTQQDVLLADVELAETERRAAELDRAVRVAAARLNTLLLRMPDAPLPPPETQARGLHQPADVEVLREMAVAERPDVVAASSRYRAEQTGIALARREYRPDLEFVARYDTFWLPQNQLVGQIGVTLNVPIQRARRDAAVRQATAMTIEKRAELERLAAEVRFRVHEAYERLNESRRIVLLFDEKLLPTARLSVETAGSSYVTGKLDFLRLIEAQQQLIKLQMEEVEAIGDYQIRWAELQRAVGGAVPEAVSPSPPPAR